MKPIIALVVLLPLIAWAGGPKLVPGKSSAADVRAAMGKPAETRTLASGETVLFYPQLPWGHVTHAARLDAGGKLIAVEQVLTEANIKKVQREKTTMKEVRDLLGPPWDPMTRPHRIIWTYPMRIPSDPTPKWFVVQMTPADGVVREAFLIDDWQFVPKDSPGQRIR